MSAPLSADGLRAAALDALSQMHDARATEILQHAVISIEPSVSEWDGSGGHISAHRVIVMVDATALAMLDFSPRLHDALCASFSIAVAKTPGESLAELVTCFGLETRDDAGPYRGAPSSTVDPHDPEVLQRALVTYLNTAREVELAMHCADATIACDSTRKRVRVVLDVPETAAGALDAHDEGTLIAAVHALFHGREDRAIEVTTRRG